MKIYFKKELLGTVISTGTGFEFPHHIGKIIQTPALEKILKYIDWARCHIDVDVYQPYDYEMYEVEDPAYPRDNAKRFLLSDNWKTIQWIDRFMEYAAVQKKEIIPVRDLENVPGLKERAAWWSSDYYGFHEIELKVEDMKAFREILSYENWRAEDDEGNEVPYFPYPIRFDTKTYGISWC